MRHLRFWFPVALLMVACNSLQAQTPLARFVLPTNTTETAVQPTFRIITSLPIDTTSVHWNLHQVDSTHWQFPVICAIPYDYYTTRGDSVWPGMAMGGSGSTINDTTIEFTANSLGNNRKCEVILMGLRVISGSDTITISDTVARMTFTTIGLPPRLITINSIDSGGSMRMHDTITARFSSKLDSTSSSGGPLLSLVTRNISFDTINDTLRNKDTVISATSWLDAADSAVLHLLPTAPLGLGRNYLLSVNLSGLTGDTTQDGVWGFHCRQSYRLNVVPQPAAGLTSLPAIHFDPRINEEYKLVIDSSSDTSAVLDSNFVGRTLKANDTATYSAPARVGSTQFWKWSCPGYSAWDNSASNPIAISLNPDQVSDVNLVALYRPIPLDTLIVSSTCASHANCGRIEVRSDSVECCNAMIDTCADSCNYYVMDGRIVGLRAYSDSNHFLYWSSNDTDINGSSSPYIQVLMNGTISVAAFFAPPPAGPPPPTATVCGTIWKGHTGAANFSGIAHLLQPFYPTYYNGCATVATVPYDVKLKITDHSYGLASYSDGSGYHHTWSGVKDLYASGGDGTYTVTVTPPGNVTFRIDKLHVTLTVNILMDDDELPEGTCVTGDGTAHDRMWCYLTQQDANSNPLPYPGSVRTVVQPNKMTYVFKYNLGDKVTLNCNTIPANADGTRQFTFNGWSDAGSNPRTITMTSDMTLTANFHEGFRVKSVMFVQEIAPNSYLEESHSVDDWGDRQTNLSEVSWTAHEPLHMIVEFNRAVRTSYGSIDYMVMPVSEEDAEFGKSPTDLAMSYPQIGANAWLMDAEGKRIGMNVEGCWETSHKLWKGQRFKIDIGTPPYSGPGALTSTTGEWLSNPVALEMSTIPPDITWSYTNTHVNRAHANLCFDSWSFTYWLAQHEGAWTGNTTCIVGDITNDNDAPAYDWADDPDGDGDDQQCVGSGEQVMVSCPLCTGAISAGAANRVSNYLAVNSGSPFFPFCPCCFQDLTWGNIYCAYLQTKGRIAAELASYPTGFNGFNAANYDAIGTMVVGPRYSSHDVWGCGSYDLSNGKDFRDASWLNGTVDFQRAYRKDWWGASDDYKKYFWKQDVGWSRLEMRVDVK